MEIIAHRGVSAHYHENTMLAFEKSLEIGVYAIEVDLHQVESEFVIFHDFQLDRLAQTRADLVDLSLVEIAQVKLQKKHRIPMLSELFALVKGQCILNLEIKYLADPALLIDKITQYIYEYDAEIVISSFNHICLRQIQQALRDTRIQHKVRIGALIAHLPIDRAQYAIDMQVEIAAIDAELVSKDFVEHAHQYNIQVWCYTVNFEKGFKRLLQMGVDAVFCNDPALMKSLL